MKLSTKKSPANIEKVIRLLRQVPAELTRLSSLLTAAQHTQPFAAGEWSFFDQIAHLIHCETITTHAIQLALLRDQQQTVYTHPQRELSKVQPFSQFTSVDLLTYFILRRTMLLSLITPLSDAQWGREIQQGDKRPQTVYKLIRTIALHEQEHIQDLTQKLKERKQC